MQAVGTIFWKVKSDYFRLFRYSSIVPPSILLAMIVSISPAFASEAFASNPTTALKNGRVTAVAGAQIIKPFTMNSTVKGGTDLQVSAIIISRRTTFRNRENPLGSDAESGSAESCDLRLIELQQSAA